MDPLPTGFRWPDGVRAAALTMHPFVSGRPGRAAAIEGLIERAQSMDGVWVAAADEIAAWVEGLDLEPVVHQRPDPA